MASKSPNWKMKEGLAVGKGATVQEFYASVEDNHLEIDVTPWGVSRDGFSPRWTCRAGLSFAWRILPSHSCARAEPLMRKGGTLFTMTYYGSQMVVKNYNIMGVAKAALESTVRYCEQHWPQAPGSRRR